MRKQAIARETHHVRIRVHSGGLLRSQTSSVALIAWLSQRLAALQHYQLQLSQHVYRFPTNNPTWDTYPDCTHSRAQSLH